MNTNSSQPHYLCTNMHRLWWIATALACMGVCVAGQSLGTNYGVNIRVTERALSYAAQKATNVLYDKYRHYGIPNYNGRQGSKITYNTWNVRISSFSRPTLNLRINRGQGVSSNVNLAYVEVTGSFRVGYKLISWGPTIRKSGTFTATAKDISLNAELGVGKEASGRPTVWVRSCDAHIRHFGIDVRASGFNWIVDQFEGKISDSVKGKITPMICKEARKYIDEKLKPQLRQMQMTTRLLNGRLLLDYSLMRAPVFASNYIDATVKGDVSWKGRKTNTPTGVRSWPTVPGSSSKMATIYLTDYIMNAMGVLMHNDGTLSYSVTKNDIPSTWRPMLSLTCQTVCAGLLLPNLTKQYPGGWLEAGVRSNAPPRFSIGNNVINGSFSGIVDIYVRRPNGQRIRAANATASLGLPLTLDISNNILKATAGNPSISVTSSQSANDDLRKLLPAILKVVTRWKLKSIGQKGFALPSFKNMAFTKSDLHIGSGVIAVSTDVNYSG